ncbi:SMI1/KNR4 family protein [Undibacterium sp. Ji42W]|uniref:SMI1/KNR4 family protein n=1 Tax=Undibacterium sp. Ji42W TaxID=3413039 RepID=UPI003BF3E806
MGILNSLQSYIGLKVGTRRFTPVDSNKLDQAEMELGFLLPCSLRKFYQAVGYGWLAEDNRPDIRNLFIHPLDIVDLYKGISEFGPPEQFLPGDVPFFDCGSFRFLVFRPNSANPEFIYRDNGDINPVANNAEDLVATLLRNPHFYEE